jgi:hypothetical protein
MFEEFSTATVRCDPKSDRSLADCTKFPRRNLPYVFWAIPSDIVHCVHNGGR